MEGEKFNVRLLAYLPHTMKLLGKSCKKYCSSLRPAYGLGVSWGSVVILHSPFLLWDVFLPDVTFSHLPQDLQQFSLKLTFVGTLGGGCSRTGSHNW